MHSSFSNGKIRMCTARYCWQPFILPKRVNLALKYYATLRYLRPCDVDRRNFKTHVRNTFCQFTNARHQKWNKTSHNTWTFNVRRSSICTCTICHGQHLYVLERRAQYLATAPLHRMLNEKCHNIINNETP